MMADKLSVTFVRLSQIRIEWITFTRCLRHVISIFYLVLNARRVRGRVHACCLQIRGWMSGEFRYQGIG